MFIGDENTHIAALDKMIIAHLRRILYCVIFPYLLKNTPHRLQALLPKDHSDFDLSN